MKIQPAKILKQHSYLVPGKLRITEHFFEVPRDYTAPHLGKLHIFAKSARRHIVTAEPHDEEDPAETIAANASTATQAAAPPQAPVPLQQPPWLLYLQGGPGFECRSPQTYPWTTSFLDKGYQMMFLDQRGTGLSSPLSHAVLAAVGDANAQAACLKHYRADNIVRDCEAIRLALMEGTPEKRRKWSLLGQSFGGFCSVSYLSMFPASLREVFITGGLPPLVDQPDEVYRRLFAKLVARNQAYYKKYPQDIESVKDIVRFLKAHNQILPGGGILTPRRFLSMGMAFGFHGGFDSVHEAVLQAWTEVRTMRVMTRQTLDLIGRALPFDNNILYAIMHEPIYCQGKAPNWSAERVMQSTYKGFDPDKTLDMPSQPTYFTGEMIFPFMFECFDELQKLQNVANILAADASWPPLYDKAQLAQNTVPVYAAVYVDDMYVDFGFAKETAKAIKGTKTLTTNVLYHNAVKAKMDEVVEGLWKLKTDVLD